MSGTFSVSKRNSHAKTNPATLIDKRSLYAKDRGLSLKAEIEDALAINNQKISERIQTQKNSKRTMTNFQLPTLQGFDKTWETSTSHQVLMEKGFDADKALGLVVKSTSSPKSSNLLPKGSIPVGMRNSAIGLPVKKSSVLDSSPKLSSRELRDTMPDHMFESEKRVIANIKLEQDRLLTQSRNSVKRTISYAHEALHRLPSSHSYDKGELLALQSVHNSLGPISPLLANSKSSIDKLKGHLTEVANGKQPRAFNFHTESTELARSTSLYTDERKVHSQIFNEHFLQSFDRNSPDKGFVAGYGAPLDKGFKVKKAFEVGTKKGAEIPRLWTTSSPRKDSPTPTPNTGSSPLRLGTSSGYRLHGPGPVTMRELTTPLVAKREVKEDPLVAELRREVPNMMSGAPASRQDVIVLGNWVDEKVDNITKTCDNEAEKYKKCEEVYNICLNELLRQVSVDCVERGELMYRIWMSYYKIFAQFKSNLDVEHEKMKAESQKEVQKMINYFDELSQSKISEVDKLKAEIESLLTEKEETDKKMAKVMDKDTRHKEKINKLVGTLTQMSAQMKELSNENELYKKRYGKKDDFGTKVGKKNHVLIEATSPINSKKGLYIPLGDKIKSPRKEPTFNQEGGDSSDESKESSIDFIFEDIDKQEQIHRMKLLNADNSDADGTPKKRSKIADGETQTHLFLMDPKYDEVLEIQKILDEVIEEFKMRQEFDGIFETLNVNEEEGADLLSAQGIQERIYDQVYSMSKKNSIDGLLLDMQRLDPNNKQEHQPSKLSRFGQQSRKDSKRLLVIRKEGGLIQDNLSSVGSPSEMGTDDLAAHALKLISSTHTNNEENEDEQNSSRGSLNSKDHHSAERHHTTNNRSGEKQEKAHIDLAPSIGTLEDSIISRDPDDIMPSHGTKEISSNFLLDNQDDAAQNSGAEKMQIIVEAPEEECVSPSVYKRGTQAAVENVNRSSMISQNTEHSKQPEQDFKIKISKPLGSTDIQNKLDKHEINDHAKLLLMTRLFRAQNDRNKTLTHDSAEMQEQILAEKQNSAKLEETITELKEQLKAYKIGRCPRCAGAGKENNGGKSSRGENGEGEDTPTMLLEEDGLDFDEDDDGEDNDNESNSGSGTTKAKTFKRKAMINRTVTMANPDHAKKKEKVSKDFAANAIIEKIKNKKVSKFKNFMPVKAICKQINNFYSERLSNAKENPTLREESLVSFVYNWYTNAFGFKKIAEQKFIIFVLSVKKYLHFVRINLFARFMNLLDGQSNFTIDEFNKYLEGIEFLNNSHLGISINNSETDSKHYTPFLRGLEYVKFFSENKMPVEEYIEFKKEFESLKENDPKNLNRNGIIDIDRLISKVLVKYRAICNRTKQFVVNAFKAADLDGNKYCSLQEFVMIYRNIESEKYDYDFVESLFSEHADVRIEGSINLSFDKFTVVCVEFGLFSDQQQDLFLNINGREELVAGMEKLQLNWPMYSLTLKEQLDIVGKNSEEDKKYWMDILDILEDRISNYQNMDPADFKPIMIAYKILSRELTDLIDQLAETDGYGVKIVKKTEQ